MAETEPRKPIEPFWERVNVETLAQGDYVPVCSVPVVPPDFEAAVGTSLAMKVRVDVLNLIVMTQSCDLENGKAPLVACCPIHNVVRFEQSTRRPNGKKISWESVRTGRQEGLHLLGSQTRPEDKWDAFVVDFRTIYSLPIDYMQTHSRSLGPR